MYQIDNHEDLAQQAVVPYLLSFNKIQNLAKHSGTRNQYIEDVIWELAHSTNIETANGIWLDYLGKKVGKTRSYFPAPTDGFTFKGTTDQGFGAGKFLSPYGIGATKLLRSNADYRNAIKAKIIQNNTNCNLADLIYACKLLFNASLVLITEQYPAGIDTINLYGSALLESTDAYNLCKLMMPAGVSLGSINFIYLNNLFKNNAFIVYDESGDIIPSTDDFTLSFTFTPDTLTSSDIPLLSQTTSLVTAHNSVMLTYNNVDGIVFSASPGYYSDDLGNYYTDDSGDFYTDSLGAIVLSGGSININEPNKVRVTRVGDDFTLYVNDLEVASNTVTDVVIENNEISKLFLGCSLNSFYNSGSIYNLLLSNDSTSTVLINDSLKNKTIGTNNGVRFI